MAGVVEVKKTLVFRRTIERAPPNPDKFTVRWTLTVTGRRDSGSGEEDISRYVDKIIFRLHQTFKQPREEVAQPPFTVTRLGYGSFDMHVFLKLKDGKTSKELNYDMNVSKIGTFDDIKELSLPVNDPKFERLLRTPKSDSQNGASKQSAKSATTSETASSSTKSNNRKPESSTSEDEHLRKEQRSSDSKQSKPSSTPSSSSSSDPKGSERKRSRESSEGNSSSSHSHSDSVTTKRPSNGELETHEADSKRRKPASEMDLDDLQRLAQKLELLRGDAVEEMVTIISDAAKRQTQRGSKYDVVYRDLPDRFFEFDLCSVDDQAVRALWTLVSR